MSRICAFARQLGISQCSVTIPFICSTNELVQSGYNALMNFISVSILGVNLIESTEPSLSKYNVSIFNPVNSYHFLI